MAEFPASLLILNGKSTDNLPLREAIMLLREEGMTIHVRVTWEKGDAARYVEEARKLGVATVIAGGGDGTINEVSTALIQCEGDDIPALGILPLGYSAAIFLIPICISFDTAEKRRYATYLILNRRFSFEF